MNNSTIASILQGRVPLAQSVKINGWIRTKRDSKANFSFLTVYDGSCHAPIQVIANDDLSNYQTEILKLTAGCAVTVDGIVMSSQGKGQAIEIKAEKVSVLGWIENADTYPIAPKRHSLEHLREVAHLRPRTNLIGAITRVRHTLAQAIHRFFDKNNFCWINTPIITASDAEGAGELFRISTLDLQHLPKTAKGDIDFQQDFFGSEAFLTVSGQLNAEAYACALSKVYTFGPTFRAENSNTTRHLAEFWMVEPEVAFASLETVITLADQLLKNILQDLLLARADDIDFFVQYQQQEGVIAKEKRENQRQKLEKFIRMPCQQIDYSDAINILQQAKCEFVNRVNWGIDLASEHERYLVEHYFDGPVVVKNYPKGVKAFYMRLNEDEKTVAAFDLLVPGIGEIIGGSQREERLAMLDRRLEELHLPKEAYWWYRDLRRYGTVPHAGFGLGFERLLSYATGIANVRDLIPFPRTPKNAQF